MTTFYIQFEDGHREEMGDMTFSLKAKYCERFCNKMVEYFTNMKADLPQAMKDVPERENLVIEG